MGEDARRLFTVSVTSQIQVRMSSSVVNLPKLKRTEACASASDSPMAFNTWDGSRVPLTHAEPEDNAISGTPTIS